MPDEGIEARFWAKVTETSSGCWEWTGAKIEGYGVLGRGSREEGNILAHRFAYETYIGAIPPGLHIDHLCRNHACVGVAPGGINLGHLEPVTFLDNLRRGRHANRQKTHCPKGHPYDNENTFFYDGGRRRCKACQKQWRAKSQ